MELKINDCEVCNENIYFDGDQNKWIMRIENSHWNTRSDGFDYDEYEVNFCYKCGNKYDKELLSPLKAKEYIGKTIKNFFCNGFFGGDEYGLAESRIIDIIEEESVITVTVLKRDGKYAYGEFDYKWKKWETVFSYLDEWIINNSE